MSKAAKPSAPADPKAGEVPFEEALTRLEAVVEAMESGELPLETLIARFEEGTRLAQVCQAKLAEAELKVKQLEKDAAGQLVARPLDPAEEPSKAS